MSNKADSWASLANVPTGATQLTESQAILADGQTSTFHCNGCGECCSQWKVPLSREKLANLQDKSWIQGRLAETHTAFEPMDTDTAEAMGLAPGAVWVPHTSEGYCVFLGSNRHCQIEAREGAEFKPDDCLRFPFAAVPVPREGTRYEVSAACKSVSEALMLRFGDIQPAPHEQPALDAKAIELYEQGGKLSLKVKRYSAPFSWLKPLSWQTFDERLKQLQALALSEGMTADALLVQAKSLMMRGKTDTISVKASSHPVPWTTRLYLRQPYGIYSLWTYLTTGEYQDEALLGRGESLALNQLNRIRWPEELGRQRLTAFTFLLLKRRISLVYGQSWSSQWAMSKTALNLVRLYARGYAQLAQAPEVSESDIALAIRTVERYYSAHQPRFLERFNLSFR